MKTFKIEPRRDHVGRDRVWLIAMNHKHGQTKFEKTYAIWDDFERWLIDRVGKGEPGFLQVDDEPFEGALVFRRGDPYGMHSDLWENEKNGAFRLCREAIDDLFGKTDVLFFHVSTTPTLQPSPEAVAAAAKAAE